MKLLFKGIATLFRWIWKGINFTRLLIINLLFFFFIGVMLFALTQQDTEEPMLDTPSALVLNLNGTIVEKRTYSSALDTLTQSAFGQEPPKENVLFDIVETIRFAASDDNITGLVLSLGQLSDTSLTQLRYIGKAIDEFKLAGKPVYAYGEIFTQSQYYLASYADSIMMSKDGGVLLTGYGSYRLYYKSLFEKLDINTHVFRVGTYKSFVEPYTRDSMSDQAREANAAWLDQLWQAYVDDVASNRKMTADALTPEIDDLLAALRKVNGNYAKFSLEQGLVDTLTTRQEAIDKLVSLFGDDGDGSYQRISYYDYSPQENLLYSNDQIAVVVASGAIMDGQEQQGAIGGDTTAALLAQARNNDAVKAVVLRVNSPGGSAFASEVIRNEVDALKAAGKPVVVSMSSTAASGGYWIASSADAIIAQPTTLTGSIGIFGLLTTFEDSLANWGIYTDGVGTTPLAGVGVTRALSQEVAELFQLGIEHGYHRFISLVAEHRNMSLEEADNVAQGRVWTGQDALRLGLVDEVGDFDDALEKAASLAELDTYRINWIRRPLAPMEAFLQEIANNVSAPLAHSIANAMPTSLVKPAKEVTQAMTLLDTLNDPKGQMAYCLNCAEIR
ncbi:signal peptide peptidase SppA [Thaumasiovibrio subtropicus]|uniref:signal peptide peptidase SppA n=1 Tax=Thaumasiovibrio subtropicus TaxID=1891207 RepID=UPI000B361609|nr:signal peptide peptidase SppA [Thaumasiovibrio subtropicus]